MMDTTKYTGQWYTSASDRERAIFKNWIRSHLVMGEMKIKFIKKDDTVRDMRCTLGAGYLPVTEEKEIKRKENRFEQSIKIIQDFRYWFKEN
jgi:hypothetical protein